jgi:hypothetical protein
MAENDSVSDSVDELSDELIEKVPYVPGTLYFMTEIDFLNGDTFPYYKIGIVKNDKEVEVRKKQHRTGNPRDIISVCDIASPAAQKLETRLHNEFAVHRVASGEWFRFSEEILAEVITRARELNDQLIAEIEILNAAKRIKGPGAGEPLDASATFEEDGASLGVLISEQAVISKAKLSISKKIKLLTEGNLQWERLLEPRQNSEKNNFSVEILKKKYKALYEEFKTKEAQSITASWVFEIPELELDQVLEKYGCPNLEILGDSPIELHQAFLSLWSAGAIADWEIERIQARLLCAASDSNGIDGILEWKFLNSKTFDREEFQKKHPDVYNDCFKKTDANVTYRVVEWASYTL